MLLEPNSGFHPHGHDQETCTAMMLSVTSYTHRLTRGTKIAGMGKVRTLVSVVKCMPRLIAAGGLVPPQNRHTEVQR